MTVKIKNATVTFSNMLNKLNKDLLSREFCIELKSDSPEIKQLQTEFKELETKAKDAFSAQVGKKVKNASTEKGLGNTLFCENEYKPGYTRLKFTIYNINEMEVKQEDGTTKKQRVEKLSPIYKNLDFCYIINNNGKKEFTIQDTDKHWLPLSNNIIDVTCSLVASYNKSDNRVTIRLKADDVNIVQKEERTKNNNFYITLPSEDEVISNKVEQVAVEENELFTVSELEELDV